MTPTLYIFLVSPPVRATLITALAIGLNLNLSEVNIMKGEQHKPEYLKINPQHTVPTLVDDDGFAVWDSHAIMPYIVSKYAKDDSLYPRDEQKRALIDQKLHFDSGILFPKFAKVVHELFSANKSGIDQADKDSINEAYTLLEAFLEGKQWLANNSLSIADYSGAATTSTLDLLVPIDADKFPNLTSWLKRMHSLPEYAANKEGLAMFKSFIQSKL